MKMKGLVLAALAGLALSCTQEKYQASLPSWNDTPVKERLMNFINVEVDKIPVEDRIAVFDMDGTLVSERPFGIETVVSIYRLLEMGEKDPAVKETIEYQYAKKLSVNMRDTSVLNHCYVNGENILVNIILKPFDGADSEEYIRFANKCLNTAKNPDYGLTYADMFYEPMLELIESLKEKQFQIYVVSASMQGIVWGICPQKLGLERRNLIGIRHPKDISFQKGGPVTYTLQASMMSPVNDYKGKVINIYNQIGKIPVMAVGNAHSDFGMFHMASSSPYPNLALLVHHDDKQREYVYSPCGKHVNWQDTVRINNWVRADISKDFKIVWKKSN